MRQQKSKFRLLGAQIHCANFVVGPTARVSPRIRFATSIGYIHDATDNLFEQSRVKTRYIA